MNKTSSQVQDNVEQMRMRQRERVRAAFDMIFAVLNLDSPEAADESVDNPI